jgi:hypothetical protein
MITCIFCEGEHEKLGFSTVLNRDLFFLFRTFGVNSKRLQSLLFDV